MVCSGLQDELEKVQNRAARFVSSNYSYEPGSMSSILSQLGWKSLKQRRKESRLILLYKGLKGKAKIPTNDLVKPTRRSRTHHDLTFVIPHARSDCYKFSFIPNTLRDWNGLPSSVIACAESAQNQVNKFRDLVKSD